MTKRIEDINFNDIDWSKYELEISEIRKLTHELMNDPEIEDLLATSMGRYTKRTIWKYLDSINDVNNLIYDDCKMNFGTEWYEAILKEVKKFNPKRVVDIGSNLNQYGYLFENEGIEYIGIDDNTTTPTRYGFMQPYISPMVRYVQADYKNPEIIEHFKDDIVISCLCVGYEVPLECVKAKHLIVNDFDENENCSAKVVW